MGRSLSSQLLWIFLTRYCGMRMQTLIFFFFLFSLDCCSVRKFSHDLYIWIYHANILEIHIFEVIKFFNVNEGSKVKKRIQTGIVDFQNGFGSEGKQNKTKQKPLTLCTTKESKGNFLSQIFKKSCHLSCLKASFWENRQYLFVIWV